MEYAPKYVEARHISAALSDKDWQQCFKKFWPTTEGHDLHTVIRKDLDPASKSYWEFICTCGVCKKRITLQVTDEEILRRSGGFFSRVINSEKLVRDELVIALNQHCQPARLQAAADYKKYYKGKA